MDEETKSETGNQEKKTLVNQDQQEEWKDKDNELSQEETENQAGDDIQNRTTKVNA